MLELWFLVVLPFKDACFISGGTILSGNASCNASCTHSKCASLLCTSYSGNW